MLRGAATHCMCRRAPVQMCLRIGMLGKFLFCVPCSFNLSMPFAAGYAYIQVTQSVQSA